MKKAKPAPDIIVGGRYSAGEDSMCVRVMAMADNYVMVRYPHCIPFTIFAPDFLKIYPIRHTKAKPAARAGKKGGGK